MEDYFHNLDLDNINTEISYSLKSFNKLISVNSPIFNLLHTNIRSISKNFNELEVLVSQIKNNLDVIVLSETWNIVNIENFVLRDYDVHYNKSTFNKNDGVILLVKKLHNYEIKIIKIKDIPNYNFIRIEINTNGSVVAITGIYKPPPIKKDLFIKIFEDYLQKYCKLEHEIITGDLNIDVLNEIDNNTHDYLDTLSKYGFVSCINKPTHELTCLDHIFIKSKIHSSNMLPVILHSKITDHSPIYLQINNIHNNMTTDRPLLNNQSKKNIIDYNTLNQNLSSINWTNLKNMDIDHSLDQFVQKLDIEIQKCTTIKNVKSKHRKRNPWMTSGLIKSINIRDALYKQHKLYPDNNDIKITFQKYKKLIPNIVKYLKTQYYHKAIQDVNSNPRKTWQLARESLNIYQPNSDIKEIRIDNHKITNKQNIANELNSFFINVGKSVTETLKIDKNQQNLYITNIPRNNKTLFLTPTSHQEIESIIKTLKNSSTTVNDDLNTLILKQIGEQISNPLSEIINHCFSTGYFPTSLKVSRVLPVHKGSHKYLLTNYRPISIISSIAKIFEKLLKNRLISFFDTNNIIANNQYGFLKNRSTEDALATLVERIYKSLDDSQPCMAVFLDLAKAFDTVNHKLLLKKLERYGIRGTGLKLIESYLNNRTQSVKIDNTISNTLTITCGVPQGTVLGPLLFLIYINDLLELTQLKDNIISYADDTVLFINGITWNAVIKEAETYLTRIKCWMDNNFLSLNYKKSKFIPFSIDKRTTPDITSIKIHESTCKNYLTCNCGISVLRTNCIRYLGVEIDNNLKWNNHIHNLSNRLRKTIYIFKKLKQYMSKSLLRTFYFALVQSILSYGIIAWGGAANSTLQKIETLQNTIVKIIFSKNKLYPTNILYLDCKIKSVKQLFLMSISKYLFKNNNLLQFTTHNYDTRRKEKALINKTNKRIGQRSFISFVPKLFNNIQQHIIDNNFIASTYKQNTIIANKIINDLNQVEISEYFK